jgi:hypothetical protein
MQDFYQFICTIQKKVVLLPQICGEYKFYSPHYYGD